MSGLLMSGRAQPKDVLPWESPEGKARPPTPALILPKSHRAQALHAEGLGQHPEHHQEQHPSTEPGEPGNTGCGPLKPNQKTPSSKTIRELSACTLQMLRHLRVEAIALSPTRPWRPHMSGEGDQRG